jgi:hypothetical protein
MVLHQVVSDAEPTPYPQASRRQCADPAGFGLVSGGRIRFVRILSNKCKKKQTLADLALAFLGIILLASLGWTPLC